MNELLQIPLGILIPFAGTTLGAAAVFFSTKNWNAKTSGALFGLAAGVMLASSVWSLLIPALSMPRGALLSSLGFLAGMFLFLWADTLLDRVQTKRADKGGGAGLLSLAVTLHNIPEGMAVGVALAGGMERDAGISMAAAMALSIGIALQNIPEGTVIAMPLCALGQPKRKAFFWGSMSGAVEPIGAVVALLFTHFISSLMPLILSFAAGAMIYVILRELIPALSRGDNGTWGCVAFSLGFVIMMLLDVLLGA